MGRQTGGFRILWRDFRGAARRQAASSVFAELHAVTIRDVVSFANPWDRVDAAGQFDAGAPAAGALETMMNKLGWWARALKQARSATPYKGA